MAYPVTSGLRRLYRAAIPLTIRRTIRSALVRQGRRLSVDGQRRFELPLPIRPGTTAATVDRRSLRIEAPRKFYVTRRLEQRGIAGYEPGTAAALLGLADVIRPAVMFDVGANVGPHALLISALVDVPVVAFEPAPDVADVLRRLVAMNHLRCTVEQLALADTEGSAVLFISPTDTSTSLRRGWREPVGETTVAVTTLDSYVGVSGQHPTLLKLDTETTEPAVLRGAAALLETRPWVVCEVYPGWNEAELHDLLSPLGYAFYHIAGRALRRHDTMAGHTTREHLNWLFAPRQLPHEIEAAILAWRAAIDATDAPTPP